MLFRSVEFWFARDLQKVLGYSQRRNFEDAIGKAKIARENSDVSIDNHFADVSKKVELGFGAERSIVECRETATC